MTQRTTSYLLIRVGTEIVERAFEADEGRSMCSIFQCSL